MGLLKNIAFDGNQRAYIVQKFDLKNDYIAKGSKLTVKEGQAAVFCYKGKMADVFLPGLYTLDTNNVPLLTKLMSWKYGFESPFRSDLYFVNTTQMTNEKWGTLNPIMLRDADYGALRIRAFGTYAFKVDDPFVFLTELSGTCPTFSKTEITDYLRSMIVTNLTDAIGEAQIPVLDMAANLLELGKRVRETLAKPFAEYGLVLTGFNFENFSLPENLQKAIDQGTELGILGKNMGAYQAKAQADAMVAAANNQGQVGGMFGAGLGMSMGMNMGNMYNQQYNQNQQQYGNGNQSQGGSFCPECGKPVNAGAKFCSNCGAKIGGSACPNCGAAIKPGAKFCPECGTKL